ncbi:MAG: S4 domain-containing protein YaaA [Mycoplasma sp.]
MLNNKQNTNIKKINISTDFITLGQLLKFSGIISNGSDVKFFLSENNVLVNNIEETRRGRKLFNNDLISINNDEILMLIVKEENI